MPYQTVFQRYELKYLLTTEQKGRILNTMQSYMQPDEYGRTTIRNLYYDTDTWCLVRNSIEAPVYKEKLRVRSYSRAEPDSTVFVELKKKFNSVVYKRRLPMTEEAAMDWLCRREPCPENSQIGREISYFLDYYGNLRPVLFLSYDREAYREASGDFRVTFDEKILCRHEALSLGAPVWGTPLLPEGTVLMELKCSGGIPLWMASALSRNGICKTSFSKYGTAYKNLIYPHTQYFLQEAFSHVSESVSRCV